MYAKIEPSGCLVSHGNVQVRFAFFLEPGDARYEERHIDGRDTSFHDHFINTHADVADGELESLAGFHLANFYAAWSQVRKMRSGWDTAHRVRPKRFELLESPEAFALRKSQCERRVVALKRLEMRAGALGEGKVFPATDIDVGAGAIGRADLIESIITAIDYNNAANDTGILDTFELWFFNTTPATTKVGTFFESPAAPDFDNRDVEVLGVVTGGAMQSFTGKDCDVTIGDWVGVYWSGSEIYIEADLSGFNGVYKKNFDQFGAGSQTYTLGAGDAISIYAEGETVGAAAPINAASKLVLDGLI